MSNVKLIHADPIQLLDASKNSFFLIVGNVETGLVELTARRIHSLSEKALYAHLRNEIGKWVSAIRNALFTDGSCIILASDEFVSDVVLASRAIDMRLVNWLIVPYPDGVFIPNKDRFDFAKLHILWLSKGRQVYSNLSAYYANHTEKPSRNSSSTYVGFNEDIPIPDELEGDVLPSTGYERRIMEYCLPNNLGNRGNILFLSAAIDKFVLESMKQAPRAIVVSDWDQDKLESFSERMRKFKTRGK